MDIAEIDKNFQVNPIKETDVEWFDVTQAPFSVHGVYYDETEGMFLRMPHEVAEKVNPGVDHLSRNSAGGRVRFMTNSPYIAVKCVAEFGWCMTNMTWIGKCGFAIYAENEFFGTVHTAYNPNTSTVDGKFAYEGVRYLPTRSLEEITVNMPLYNHVYKMYIGLKKGSALQEAKPYAYSKPVVYYGSSITQGGCASHPGNEYQAFLSRWLDCDHVNLGFSGSARGEKAICDYLATLDMSVFVMDYDHNAPTVEHLRNTHYAVYEAVRKAQPKTPIIMMCKPDFHAYDSAHVQRRTIVHETYQRAKKQGDKLVWYIDGEKLFHKHERSACTVDSTHPNDLGFYRMAQTIAPVLKKALKKSQCKKS